MVWRWGLRHLAALSSRALVTMIPPSLRAASSMSGFTHGTSCWRRSNNRLRHPVPVRGRDRVVALIREADEGGLGAIDLLVELADLAAALAMRVHDDPFAALVHVHREMLAVWRERV
jgi:hypothetical protein